MTRLCAPLWIALTLAACGRGAEQANQAAAKKTAAAVANQADVTPMAQRVAVLGILNKRNGIVQNVALHPGQSARWKDVIVRLRACETTAPWEAEKLTGAFVQVDVQGSDKRWRRAFSGWLYKESPSLNVVEHPVYDVWPKSCEMTYPAGPPAPAAPVTSSNRSSATKSAGASSASPAASPSAVPGAAERRRQQRHIGFARNADRAQRGEVVGHELAIEQREIAAFEARHEPCQRDLGGVTPAAEHALAEKGPAELHAVNPADEIGVLPHLDRMGVARAVERQHCPLDLGVDPGFVAIGAAGDDSREIAVVGHFEAAARRVRRSDRET